MDNSTSNIKRPVSLKFYRGINMALVVCDPACVDFQPARYHRPSYAYYNGIVLEIEPGLSGAAFYIPTMIVPPPKR